MGIVIPSFPIGRFTPISYVGDLTSVTVQFLSSGGIVRPIANGAQQILQQGHQSLVVNTSINWAVAPYFKAGLSYNAASMNFVANNSGAAGVLDKILMLYINNVSNGADVTVYFADTGMLVTCRAGASGYFPVFTNILNCVVFNGIAGSGAGASFTQGIGSTQILFCNFAVPPFSTQEFPSISNMDGIDLNFTVVNQAQRLLSATIAGYTLSGINISIPAGTAIAAGGCICTFGLFDTQGHYLAYFKASAIAAAAGFMVFNNSDTVLSWNANPFLFDTVGELDLVCLQLVNLVNVIVGGSISYTTL